MAPGHQAWARDLTRSVNVDPDRSFFPARLPMRSASPSTTTSAPPDRSDHDRRLLTPDTSAFGLLGLSWDPDSRTVNGGSQRPRGPVRDRAPRGNAARSPIVKIPKRWRRSRGHPPHSPSPLPEGGEGSRAPCLEILTTRLFGLARAEAILARNLERRRRPRWAARPR